MLNVTRWEMYAYLHPKCLRVIKITNEFGHHIPIRFQVQPREKQTGSPPFSRPQKTDYGQSAGSSNGRHIQRFLIG